MKGATQGTVIRWLKTHPLLLLAMILLLCDLLRGLVALRTASGELTVAFLDVGQGDAVYIEGPNGNQVLYDAGPPGGEVLRSLSSVMPFWDRSLDVIILSHPDQDHIGGFPEILRRYRVGTAIEPGSVSDNGTHDTVEQAIVAEGAKHLLARRGMTIDLGDGAVLEVLYPDRDMSRMETNASSIALRLSYGETAFFLSGDLPIAIENYLVLTEGEDLHADVLKLGHHGSRTSTGEALLAAVQPTLAVGSMEKDSRYGHPHKEVLDRLEKAGIPLLRTDEEGTIVLRSDGKNISQ